MKKVRRKEEIKEEPREESPPPSMEPAQVVPLPNWEDMFPHKWEVLRQVSMSKKKEDYPPNPYRYNLQKSAPKPPLGPSPLKPKRIPDEIKEKIHELEQVSKECVSTVGKGIDAYWMMSKDLENKVDDVESRVELLVKLVVEMADEKNKLLIKVEGLQNDVDELTAHFANLSYACNWKQVKKGDVFSLPKKD